MSGPVNARVHAVTVLGPRVALVVTFVAAMLAVPFTDRPDSPAALLDKMIGWGGAGLLMGSLAALFLPLRKIPSRPLGRAALRTITWLTVLWLVARLSTYAESEPIRFAWMAAIFMVGGIITAETTVPMLMGVRWATDRRARGLAWVPLMGPSLFVACAATTVGCPRQFTLVDLPDEPTTRVALIGLDGADRHLLDLASRTGRTPHVDRLRRTGAWGDLSPEVAFSPPSWTTIATGFSAREHGVDGFLQRLYPDGHRGPENPTALGHRADRIAQRLLDNSGDRPTWLARPSAWVTRHIALPALEKMIPSLREPFDWVATDAKGVQKARLWEIAADQNRSACVVRWLFTDPAPRVEGLRILSGWQSGWRTPVGASNPDLLQLAQSLSNPTKTTPDRDGLTHYIETASQEVTEGRQLARSLAEGTDLYAHVFYFPDGLGHRLAHALDDIAESPDSQSDAIRFLDLLGEVDQLIGELVKSGFSVVIVSDHGMEPLPPGLPVPVVSQVLEVDWGTLLAATKLAGSRGDWFRPSPASDLRLEPTALAPPGAVERAATVLGSLRTADGTRLFGSVSIRRGAVELSAPLRVEITELSGHVLASPDLGPLDQFVHRRGIEGIHGRPLPGLDREMGHDGILIAKGPGLSGGRRVDGLRNRDVAPMILHMLGLPLEPGHTTDGIDALFDPAYLAAHSPSWQNEPTPPPHYAVAQPSSGDPLGEVRALGYLN